MNLPQGAWWIDEPKVLGSRAPSESTLSRMRALGFEVLVSLLGEHETAPYDVKFAQALGLDFHHIPVDDFSAPTGEQISSFLRLIKATDGPMILHCAHGFGRTGTFAAAYWMARGFSYEAAVIRVREARPGAVETQGQLAVLKELESRLRSGG